MEQNKPAVTIDRVTTERAVYLAVRVRAPNGSVLLSRIFPPAKRAEAERFAVSVGR